MLGLNFYPLHAGHTVFICFPPSTLFIYPLPEHLAHFCLVLLFPVPPQAGHTLSPIDDIVKLYPFITAEIGNGIRILVGSGSLSLIYGFFYFLGGLFFLSCYFLLYGDDNKE